LTTLSGRWPKELPLERLEKYGQWIDENLSHVNVVKAEQLVDSPEMIKEAIRKFKREAVDIIVMLYGAFTGDDVSCGIADELRVPVVLWAPYEPPFEKDTRLFANALVAATMNAASLTRLGHTSYVVYGSKEDERATSKLLKIINAYNTVKKLKGTVLGMLGYRPTAFYNSTFDEGLIRRTFGIRMEETDLKVVFDRMEKIDSQKIENDMKAVSEKFDVSRLPDGHLKNHSKLYFALKEVIREQKYDFSTIKCWPEMGQLKTTPCAVMGRLADDEDMNIICEGDVDAGIALIVQNYLTNQPAFIADMINIDEEKNTMTYWHCGQAPLSLMNPKHEVTINNHPLAGQGTAFYGSLKEGKVTIARFCNINGKYKLFLLKGEAVDTPRYTRGVMVNVIPKAPVREIVENIVKEGIPHHYSVVWQDVADEMKAIAGLLGIEVIEM
jgi:L-fucose isomerase-like protein